MVTMIPLAEVGQFARGYPVGRSDGSIANADERAERALTRAGGSSPHPTSTPRIAKFLICITNPGKSEARGTTPRATPAADRL